MKAKRIMASDEASWRSQFFQSRRHFSSHEIVRSTTQRFEELRSKGTSRVMSLDRPIKLLKALLAAETAAGRPPGTAPQGIFDGPQAIQELIEELEAYANQKGKTPDRSLVGSVYGGYLGRGALFWQQGLDREFHPGFTKELAAAMEYLIILSSRGMG
jgi:hypothetical protein